MTKLKALLKKKKLTQLDVVQMSREQCVTPIMQNTISRICSGERSNYSVETLIKLCRILDVTPNDILSTEQYTYLFKR